MGVSITLEPPMQPTGARLQSGGQRPISHVLSASCSLWAETEPLQAPLTLWGDRPAAGHSLFLTSVCRDFERHLHCLKHT